MGYLKNNLSSIDEADQPGVARLYDDWVARHRGLQTRRLAAGLVAIMLLALPADIYVYGWAYGQIVALFHGATATLAAALFLLAARSPASLAPWARYVSRHGMLFITLPFNLTYAWLLHGVPPAFHTVMLVSNLVAVYFTSFAMHRFARDLTVMNTVSAAALIAAAAANRGDAANWDHYAVVIALCHAVSWVVMSIHRQDFLKELGNEVARAVELAELEREAERSSQDAFVGVHMSLLMHEINNMIFVIEAATSDETAIEPSVGRHLTGSVDHMRELVAVYLADLREGAKDGAKQRLTSVKAFSDWTDSFLGAVVRSRGGTLTSGASDAALGLVFRERPRGLATVVLNLVKNALEAAQPGGDVAPSIGIEISSSGDEVHVDVTDNGPGLPPDMAERLVVGATREVRTHAGGAAELRAAAGRSRGHGIGLSVVRNECAKSGFRIAVLPPLNGSGTRIRVTARAERPVQRDPATTTTDQAHQGAA